MAVNGVCAPVAGVKRLMQEREMTIISYQSKCHSFIFLLTRFKHQEKRDRIEGKYLVETDMV